MHHHHHHIWCRVQDDWKFNVFLVPEWNLIFLSNLGLCWRCLKCQNRASLNFVWLHECRSAAQIHKFGVNSLFICCGKSYTSNTILHLDTIPFFLASCGVILDVAVWSVRLTFQKWEKFFEKVGVSPTSQTDHLVINNFSTRSLCRWRFPSSN